MASTKASSPSSLGPDELVRRIREGLETLSLPRAAHRLDELLADPPADLSRLQWLWELLEPQVHARLESRVERRIKESRLPERKTLESFDFAFQPSLDKDLVLELATLRFLDQGKNVLLGGQSGTGKSHIAMALALNACAANRRVRYTTSAHMLAALNAALACDALNRALKDYTRPELLLIDEVGLEQIERVGARRSGLMQKVLLPRCAERRSTIVTSNIAWEGWGEYLEDHLGATALLDRLIHHSHVLVIQGPSWRAHEHERQVAEAASKRDRPAKKRTRTRPS